jgi:ribonucleoside-diphosphate reductase beta chain
MLKVFNPNGNDDISTRQSFNGNSTGILNLNNVKYDWALQLYEQLRSNFWVPQKIDITQDKNDYNNLTLPEQRAYDGILSYLVYLDSVQVQNIPYLTHPCTAPEIMMCFTEQSSQEVMHSASYQYIIETILPKDKRQYIYDYWREDKVLFERCKTIGNYYQNYIDNPNSENHLIALMADYILEGLYFYTGFLFFYNLSSRSLMTGSADIFKMINRDELSHVRLYQKLLSEQLTEGNKPYLIEMMKKGVEDEIKWNQHIIGDQILGFPLKAVEDYIKYLANTRLGALGINKIYPDAINSFKHLEKIADTSKEATTKVNFFDSTVTSYQIATTIDGWNDI